MMNERIEELIKQATVLEEPDGLFVREVFDKEKFAELIMRECRPWLADDAFEEVKKHFGLDK
jgi:hypothetical protein